MQLRSRILEGTALLSIDRRELLRCFGPETLIILWILAHQREMHVQAIAKMCKFDRNPDNHATKLLATLNGCGVATSRKQGTKRFYCLTDRVEVEPGPCGIRITIADTDGVRLSIEVPRGGRADPTGFLFEDVDRRGPAHARAEPKPLRAAASQEPAGGVLTQRGAAPSLRARAW